MRRWIEAPPRWLIFRAPVRIEPVPDLGRGEAEAISLALELRADILLVDEHAGRNTAMARGLRPAGVLYVLALGAEKGLVNLREAFARLDPTNFRRPASLMRQLLARFGH